MTYRVKQIVLAIMVVSLMGWGLWLVLTPPKSADKAAVSPAQPAAPKEPAVKAVPDKVPEVVKDKVSTPTRPPTPEPPINKPIEIPATLTLKPLAEKREDGPVMPPKRLAPVPSTETKVLELPQTEARTELLYGYEGKEQDKYKLNLGVSDDGVKLQTRLKTDQKAQQVELEGVEIEIKLPK